MKLPNWLFYTWGLLKGFGVTLIVLAMATLIGLIIDKYGVYLAICVVIGGIIMLSKLFADSMGWLDRRE